MTFLIQRVDFDNPDARNAERRTVLGYCPTRDEANAYATELRINALRVENYYWGYDQQVYPKIEVIEVPELIRKMDFGA